MQLCSNLCECLLARLGPSHCVCCVETEAQEQRKCQARARHGHCSVGQIPRGLKPRPLCVYEVVLMLVRPWETKQAAGLHAERERGPCQHPALSKLWREQSLCSASSFNVSSLTSERRWQAITDGWVMVER